MILRGRNIEKLFQCNADWCFGLVISSNNSLNEILSNNFKKIKNIFNEVRNYYSKRDDLVTSKRFWLGIVSMDFLKEIDFT